MKNFEELLLIRTDQYTRDLIEIDKGLYANTPPTTVGNLKILFTGYLFNFNELNKKGHKSTEYLIAELYQQYTPEQAIEMLEGYYSAIIIDGEKITVWMDKYGVESGYYVKNKGGKEFIFSTCPHLLKKYYPFELNQEIIPYYLVFTELPKGKSFFKDIELTQRAEYLQHENGEMITGSYNYLEKLTKEVGQPNKKSDRQILDETLAILQNNFTQLKSQYPGHELKNQLSGGLDSSFIQSVLLGIGENHSYCNNIRDYGLDGTYSKDVADFYKCSHTVYEIDAKELKQSMDAAIYSTQKAAVFIGEAMLGHTFPYVNENKPAICISGNGTDTIFGYTGILKTLKLFEGYAQIIKPIAGLMGNFDRRFEILKHVQAENSSLNTDIIRIAYADNKFLEALSPEQQIAVLHEKMQAINRYSGRYMDIIHVSRVFENEVSWQNPVIYKLAKQSNVMIYFTFSNEDILSYLLTVPIERKMKRYTSKFFVKKHLKNVLPKEFMNRKKIGKNPPWDEILNTSITSSVNSYNNDFLKGLLNEEYLNSRYGKTGFENFTLKLINLHLLNISIGQKQ